METGWERGAGGAPWLTLAGTVALLVGFGWDVVLHQLDPSLAAREGILTLANPGHALVATGLGLSVAGTMFFLIGRLVAWDGRSRGRRLALRVGLIAFMALVTASVGLSAWGGAGLDGHVHAVHAVTAAPCTAMAMAPHEHTPGTDLHRHASGLAETGEQHGGAAAPDSTGVEHACTAVVPAQ